MDEPAPICVLAPGLEGIKLPLKKLAIVTRLAGGHGGNSQRGRGPAEKTLTSEGPRALELREEVQRGLC